MAQTKFINSSMLPLKVVIENSKSAFSLLLDDIDLQSNNMIMRNIIGTLLRPDEAHRRAGFLASNWFSKDEGKTWVFKFRENLICSDDTPINAETFVTSFNMLLKHKSKVNPKLPVFHDLVGWDNFVLGKSPILEGLAADMKDNTVSFSFLKPKGEDLLAFLSMSHFGHFCANNFDSTGTPREDYNEKFISSGSYEVKIFKQFEVILKKRDSFAFDHITSSPKEILIKHSSENLTADQQKDVDLILAKPTFQDTQRAGLSSHVSARVRLTALVISPYLEKPGFTNQYKQALYRNLSHILPQKLPRSSDFSSSRGFYTSSNRLDVIPEVQLQPPTAGTFKLIYSRAVPTEVIEIVAEELRLKLGNKSELIVSELDRSKPTATKDFISNKVYEFRLVSVVTGGNYVNWMTKMMFCSDLGVGFPDPDGKICEIANQVDEGTLDPVKAADLFEIEIARNGSVIPLLRSGEKWFYSNRINGDTLPKMHPIPIFSRIEFK